MHKREVHKCIRGLQFSVGLEALDGCWRLVFQRQEHQTYVSAEIIHQEQKVSLPSSCRRRDGSAQVTVHQFELILGTSTSPAGTEHAVVSRPGKRHRPDPPDRSVATHRPSRCARDIKGTGSSYDLSACASATHLHRSSLLDTPATLKPDQAHTSGSWSILP